MRFTKKNLVVISGVMAVLAIFAFTNMPSEISPSNEIKNSGAPNHGQSLASLADVKNSLNMPVTMPTYLPNGMKFESGYAYHNGTTGHITFSNENTKVEYYIEKTSQNTIAQMNILPPPVTITYMEGDKVIGTEQIHPAPAEYDVTLIHGVTGIIVAGDEHNPRSLIWYDSNGVYHSIKGDLSHTELIKIGNSMPTAVE